MSHIQMCFWSKENGSNCSKLPGESHNRFMCAIALKDHGWGHNDSCHDSKLLFCFSLQNTGFHQSLNLGSPMRVRCLGECHPPRCLQKTKVENHGGSLCSLPKRSEDGSMVFSSLSRYFVSKLVSHP